MQILISNNTTKPIYEQIVTQIKNAIMSGELKCGEIGRASCRERVSDVV